VGKALAFLSLSEARIITDPMPSRKHTDQEEVSFVSSEDVSVVPDEDLSAEALAEEETKPHKGFGKSDSKLKEELKAVILEKQKYLEGWQRAQADLVNYKRIADEERKGITTRAISTLIEELLPVLDSFDLAFGNKEAWESAPKNWRDGIMYIHQQLMRTLSDRDLEVIDPLGMQFNPHEHEAIAHVPIEEEEKEGTIIAVRQKGYRLKDKIIRPARVEVADFKEA
jgi:molecular chaperone GrpE